MYYIQRPNRLGLHLIRRQGSGKCKQYSCIPFQLLFCWCYTLPDLTRFYQTNFSNTVYYRIEKVPLSVCEEKSAVKCSAAQLKKRRIHYCQSSGWCHQQACCEIAIFFSKTDYTGIDGSSSNQNFGPSVNGIHYSVKINCLHSIQKCKGKSGPFFIVTTFCCCAINPRCFLQFPVHIFQDGTLWPW